MKKAMLCAVALLLCTTLSYADDAKRGISISFDSNDPRVQLGPRRNAHDARLAITTRDGSTSVLLMNDVVAVQLSDHAISQIKPKDEDSFIEELVASGVQVALRRAVAYPLANIRAVEVRNGVLTIVNDRNQPVFTDIKINGTDVLRDVSAADAARFVSAFRAMRDGARH